RIASLASLKPALGSRRFWRSRRRRRRRREFGVVHRNVLLNVLDLDRESVARPRQGPTERQLHAIRIAIVRIVDPGWVASERSFSVPHEAQQQAGFLVQEQTERWLALGASDNHVSIMTIDFSTRIDAEFLVERLQVCRQVKIRIDACGVIFRGRHRMYTAGNTEPSLFTIERCDAVPSLEMHDRDALIRSLRINIDGKMLAAECCERSLLHAARDFLERIGTADGGKIFIEKLVRSR